MAGNDSIFYYNWLCKENKEKAKNGLVVSHTDIYAHKMNKKARENKKRDNTKFYRSVWQKYVESDFNSCIIDKECGSNWPIVVCYAMVAKHLHPEFVIDAYLDHVQGRFDTTVKYNVYRNLEFFTYSLLNWPHLDLTITLFF